ncbi:LysR family transcriptional regulator [Paenibacillus sp. N3.4]|uniref:LysR family transcriptional regulator n=1 Tax=Paenibacillus sp. N3.4 TaxID=2603222 RepID=UPI0011CB7183|nr:LysR family transcriptional regulator [Paenibacillus sp. N3.4]TXK81448.1 LysR family transcriptional regulator [Paenibacillus sp. N3.4]
MDLKELTTFRTIIEEGTFSKAAAKLNYAQSTVTNQVQRLEKELGLQLFKRGWDAELTASGKIYADEVEGLIKHWNFVLEQAKSLQKEEIGVLNIGVTETITASILPVVLQKFRALKPNMTCHFIVGNTDSLTQALLHNWIDFAICAQSQQHSSLQFEFIYNEQISFITSKSHPFAQQSTLHLEDLNAYPLIMGGQNCLYHMRLEMELSQLSTKPFFYSVSQISAIPSFVQNIPSVGVVLASLPLSAEVVRIPIPMTNPYIPIGLLQNSKKEYLSSTKNIFLQLLKDELLGSDFSNPKG